MKNRTFIGRKEELERLKILHDKKIPGLVVVKGRRRVGKSRLITEFATQKIQTKLWSFSGLAPQEGMSAQNQQEYFVQQLSLLLQTTLPPLQDWSLIFDTLSQHVNPGDVVLLDEISWMGSKDPSFIPKLKAWWDKQTKPILLVLCGSVSTWVEENILKSTAFFGRIQLTITLGPLSIPEGAELLKTQGFQGSAYDTYKLLSVLGGIPWYLEQIGTGFTADEHLRQLCFQKDGLLVLEFDRIFHDLFGGKGSLYQKILHTLKDGMKTLSEVRKSLKFSKSGTLSQCMQHLIIAGFIRKQPLWSFKTNQPTKQSLYGIFDPYIRFYLKLIEPNKNKIALGGYQEGSLPMLPGFEAHLGLQLELLLLQNRPLLIKALGISSSEILADGPYRQSKTALQKGCQIDYLIQTLTKNLFICEFKFKRRELSTEVIEALEEKIRALKIPRGMAPIPVLFHLGDISTSLATSNYFYRIVDTTNFLI